MNWKLIKKVLRKRDTYFHYVSYAKYYKRLPIAKDVILLESQRGMNLNGNIFYLVKELLTNPEFDRFTPFLVVDKSRREDFHKLLAAYGLENKIHLVDLYSKEYYKLCASAEYLINDTSFLPFFIKKDGQKILNTWHGTPLKSMGRKDMSGYHSLGNVQRNFILSDLLLYPNDYTKHHMIEDYMLENLAPGKAVMSGYPRNEAFFQPSHLREKLELDENVKVYAYMPTWRGSVGKVNEKASFYVNMYHLLEVDKRLNDNEILYVNLHPFLKKGMDYSVFQHIRPFPEDVETYEFLNLADVLVTDYSSVFFDFANTGRKIVLYAYDKDEYFQDRGVYVPLEDMPFPIAEDADALIQELRSPKQYDDADFRQTFDPYDGPQASKLLLEQFLLGKNNLKTESIPNNGKHNVLLYGGNLAKNGLTSSLVALLNTIDLSKRNYIVAFPAAKAAKHKEVILTLPEGVSYMPIMGKTNATLSQKIASRQFRKNRRSAKAMEPVYDDMYHDDLKRLFGDAQFTDYVHFTGYDYKRIQLFARAAGNRVIFVHNNMVEEIKTRNSQHGKTLEYAYNTYDKVAIVSEDMKEPTKEYCHEESRMTLVNNTIDHKSIRKRGKKPIVFDEDTLSTHTLEELQVILDNDEKKFITVGRFSPEKGHDQLMKAFDKTFAQHPNTWLVIIGGHGPLYEDTLALRDTLSSKEHIIIIQSMKNPQPVIRQCDYFFLSSHHEGLGLVLLEADIQGLPVVSTDILGPRGFVNAHGGTLVEDSVSGLAKGMEMSLAGQVSAMNVDYDAYNKQAAAEFESVLEPVS